MKLETNEESTCKYTEISTFDFEKATEMNKDDSGMKHSLSISNNYYKISCQDRFTNQLVPFIVYVANVKGA